MRRAGRSAPSTADALRLILEAPDVHVLVVEDDPAIAQALVDGLPRYGFTVEAVSTGARALERHHGADVVLLDLGLPDLDGIDVCRRLRAESDVPLIIVTARSDEVDRVVGLELGADDYLSKPFGMRELVARIRAVLRRSATAPFPDTSPGTSTGTSPGTSPSTQPTPDDEPDALVCGELRVEVATRRVYAAGVELALTPKEFDLLAVLAARPGVVHVREDLIARVWDVHWFGSTRTLDVHVGSLRRKLGGSVDIQTVRGVGFRLEPAGAGR